MTLPEYIATHLNRPFKWGEHDCVLFAAGWVRQASGIDPLEGIAAWSTEREALRAIKAVGGLEAALDARFQRVNPNLAPDGAVTIVQGAVCLFSGPHVVAPGPECLTFYDRTEAQCAWCY